MTAIENAQIKLLAEQIAAIQEDIKDIKTGLMGNPVTMDGGLVRRLETIEADHEGLLDWKKRFTWTFGLLAVLGFLAEVVYHLTGIIQTTKH
jgi:hypothetical protein